MRVLNKSCVMFAKYVFMFFDNFADNAENENAFGCKQKIFITVRFEFHQFYGLLLFIVSKEAMLLLQYLYICKFYVLSYTLTYIFIFEIQKKMLKKKTRILSGNCFKIYKKIHFSQQIIFIPSKMILLIAIKHIA